MPVFAYKGYVANGKQVSGVQDADNARTLRATLKRDGIYMTEAKEANLRLQAAGQTVLDEGLNVFRALVTGRFSDIRSQQKQADRAQVAILTRQLAVLLKAGVPLAEALSALVDQSDRAHVKRILADVKTQVNEGSSLADALARHGSSFEDLYVNMVRAGETAGNLDAVLFRLADFLKAQNRLRAKVTSAMFYPIAMTAIGAVIMTILMTTVVPKLTSIFKDLGKELPLNTQILIFVSETIGDYWYVILGVIAGSIFGFRRWRRTPSGRETWDTFILRVWVVGELVRMIAISRFAKTLATMLSAGVPLLRALEIVKNILGNVALTKVVEEARESIKEGESIAAPLKRSGQFPPIVTHMIAVGERSGQLESMLENIAESFDIEVDTQLQRMTTLLEPLMILIMGGSLAFIVFSVLGPILKMNEFVN